MAPAKSETLAKTLFTIGYEKARPQAVLDELKQARVKLLVDTRAVAASRRPGFSKRALAASLDEIGIAYIHLQKLGTPAEGREAARAGDYDTAWKIYDKHIKTADAQTRTRRACLTHQGGQARVPALLRARSGGMPPQPHRRAGEKARQDQREGSRRAAVLITRPAGWPAA